MTSKQNTLKNNDLSAILMVTFGYFSYSVMDALSKLLTNDFEIAQITMTINGISAIILGSIIYKKHGLDGFKVIRPGLHAIRVLLFLGVPYLVLKALILLEVSEFYSVIFTTPLLLILTSTFILKEPLNKQQLIMTLVGFAGILLSIQGQIASNGMGIFYSLMAACLLTANTLVLRRIPTGTTPLTLSFYPAIAFTLVYGFFATSSYVIPSDPQWVILMIAGIAVFCGQIGCVSGFTRASTTSTVAPYHYTQMIWGILFGYFMFNHVPSTLALIGTVLIIYSGLYIALFTKRNAEQ